MLVTLATGGAGVQQLSEFKNTLKEHLMVILADKELDEQARLANAAVQAVKELQTCLQQHGLAAMDSAKEQSLHAQVIDLSKPDNRVRLIIQRRVLEFVEGVASSPPMSPIQIPPGLSALQKELTEIGGSFLQLVAHNQAVFREYYTDIIAGLTATAAGEPSD